MVNITVSSLKGNEILGEDIKTSTGIVLIPAGTRLKESYIKKLKELDIFSVCIKNQVEEKDIQQQYKETIQDCSYKVKDLIEKHFYSNVAELSELKVVAERIISDALSKPEMIITMNNLRHNKEDLYFHSVSVCAISVLIATKMRLKEGNLKQIAIGALLHDIGYSYVNAKIANMKYKKDDASKSINEIKERKMHVIYGYEMVENEKWLSKVAKEIILNHHERIDGTGYPFKRKGDGIDIGSRIVAVADEFDNIVNGKSSYNMKVYMAIDKIVSESGKLFDDKVIAAFIKCVSTYPVGTVVITNTKEIGVVVRQNSECSTRPVIKILKDSNGNDVNDYIERDLTKCLTVFIDDTIE